jgi:hypothetical protein
LTRIPSSTSNIYFPKEHDAAIRVHQAIKHVKRLELERMPQPSPKQCRKPLRASLASISAAALGLLRHSSALRLV